MKPEPLTRAQEIHIARVHLSQARAQVYSKNPVVVFGAGDYADLSDAS